MADWSEIILRLGAATLAGSAIGLDRDLRGKPIGLKTLGLVSLSTAMVVLLAAHAVAPGQFTDAISRVIQGVLTGIGFLGAGVIVRQGDRLQVRGLTSAACTLFAACVGVVCGAGHWPIVLTALVLAFLLLTFGKRTERWLHHALGGKEDPSKPGAASGQSSDAGPHQPGK
ncbi:MULTISPECIES: MgtC/SapB family protein [Bradyrhizobium]|uniref:MgtC/SapB family protein n=1 Tax=Bradyrhizobium TaxID=374 RepID=UPI000412C9D1|nr:MULTISPECIES: MgtC/SapB family protein [Bradyrhizobium]KIU43239.1 magnesium transporter [Bradyrhizobium elkanii]MBK5650689.1 MgtC/SapB family protein [Rhizobium sp.]OCX29932.1 magnesium transporter [Bradyrhizobium sp. UASWS1016]